MSCMHMCRRTLTPHSDASCALTADTRYVKFISRCVRSGTHGWEGCSKHWRYPVNSRCQVHA